ncbi:MAG: UDP-N-acetylmuramoyl-L-alanyl-D-glutamate--2,6-diaminopimelate ligase [Candidatus Omnitrophica bacterium]|nr:UDP-N-acetylmuramoyl-L-alanyl-D-glutamate--2,6-diaminopimelate ligase [Candidatus Omnitrophota bacterium]
MIEGVKVFEGISIREWRGAIPASIHGLTGDSRTIQSGDLFVALRGESFDGHDFLDQAAENGACAAVVERFNDAASIPQILVENTLAALPHLAANFYDHPARELKIYGITGSNGKTTSSYLLESILQANGHKTAVIGTIEYRYAGKRMDAPNTTPLPHDMQRLLRDIVDSGVRHVIMEVSSHGLALHRVDEIRIGVALFTNLSQDHLDFHKNMDDYRETKKRLFTDYLTGDGVSVLNLDDLTGRRYAQELQGRSIMTFAIDRDADMRARDMELLLNGSRFTLETHRGDRVPLQTPLIGRHNASNILAAAAAAWAGGVSLDVIRRGIENVQAVPGRLESIPNGVSAQIVVDYCHTPDALEKCLHTLNAIPHERILTIFGCGGDRDRAKRPLMGEIALRFSDKVFVTSDNPRTEDPQRIIDDILAGMTHDANRYVVIPDRREAIRAGVQELQPGDLLLIAGKGHETYQILGRIKTPFDDRLITLEYLQQAGKEAQA